ncbi:ribonuclease P protein component [Pelagibius sp.]|uniref:ribonuclease P protein component n=1 Tax=Pelagibius sp. TaxID=1931238 RepID=UPI002639DE6F|nr:ribonuclease P protein component [Pelagibius sp.]
MPTVGRLKTRPQFLRVAAAKRKWATPGLVLQAAQRPEQRRTGTQQVSTTRQRGAPATDRPATDRPATGCDDQADVRVGFTVTRRIGNAVTRNRAKRRLRAAAAEIFPRLGRKGTDYVVIGRAGTLTRPYDKLLGDLEQAIGRLDRRQERGKKARHEPGDGKAPGAAPQGTPEEAS